MRAGHFIQVPGDRLPAELLAIRLRTRLRRLPDSPACICSWSPAVRAHLPLLPGLPSGVGAQRVRHEPETAIRALRLAFRSPSPHLKFEFQGGEPLLNFPLCSG